MRRVIIDANNLANIAFYSTGGLRSEGEDTGTIYGFFRSMLDIGRYTSSNNLIFCFDAKPYYRRKISSTYKANREKKELTDDEYLALQGMYRQIDLLKSEILPIVGFKNVFGMVGYEADDLIATAATNGDCIISGDQDLYQLCHRGCEIRTSRGKVTNEKIFKETYGIPSILWAEVKAIAGCTSDNVLGVKGVAETTAIKYIKGELGEKTKAFKAIERFKKSEDYVINKRLVTLPLRKPGKVLKMTFRKNKLNYNALIRFFEKKRFYSFLEKGKYGYEQWHLFCRGG